MCEVHIIDRGKFTIAGKVEFLPPGAAKTDVAPADLVMTRDGKTAYASFGHAGDVAVVDVETRKDGGLYRTPVGLGLLSLAGHVICFTQSRKEGCAMTTFFRRYRQRGPVNALQMRLQG